MKNLKLTLLLLSVLFLASCGGGLSGTYVQANSNNKLVFSGSKVQAYIEGTISEAAYKKDGDQVKITVGDKTEVLLMDKNGCIIGDDGGKFCKQ